MANLAVLCRGQYIPCHVKTHQYVRVVLLITGSACHVHFAKLLILSWTLMPDHRGRGLAMSGLCMHLLRVHETTPPLANWKKRRSGVQPMRWNS